jgi:anti-anti-sigma regulatory factor
MNMGKNYYAKKFNYQKIEVLPMNLSVNRGICFYHQPSLGKDLFNNMGHTRLYSNSLKIDAFSNSGTMQVALAGQLGSSTIEKIDEFLLNYRYHFKRFKNITFDISRLEFTNRFGLAALIDLVYVLKQEGLRISFVGAGQGSRQVLRDAGFYEWLEQ